VDEAVELIEKIMTKLSEATVAVAESSAAYRQIISSENPRTTTVADVEAAERLAWEAHQQLAGLMIAHDQVLRSLQLALLSAGAPGWNEEAGGLYAHKLPQRLIDYTKVLTEAVARDIPPSPIIATVAPRHWPPLGVGRANAWSDGKLGTASASA
jgi:hypothetical protein